jgi:hypothetical protein
MEEKYRSHEVSNGNEITVIDKDGDKYSGRWSEDRMRSDKMINLGRFHDPIRGSGEVAGFPISHLTNGCLVTGLTEYGAPTLMTNIEKQVMRNNEGLVICASDKETVRKILFTVPDDRKEDTVHLNLGSDDGFNILQTSRQPSEDGYDEEIQKRTEHILRALENMIDEDINKVKDILTDWIRSALGNGTCSLKQLRDILCSQRKRKEFLAENESRESATYKLLLLNEIGNELSKALPDNTGVRSNSPIDLVEVLKKQNILLVDFSGLESQANISFSLELIMREFILARELIPEQHRYFISLRQYSKLKLPKLHGELTRPFGKKMPMIGMIVHIQHIKKIPKSDQKVLRKCKIPISLNSGPGEKESCSVAQLHNVGPGKIKGLDLHEAILSPITEDGYTSDIAVKTQLFNLTKPNRTDIEDVSGEYPDKN